MIQNKRQPKSSSSQLEVKLSTHEAANILNVSRPYLMKLLEQGKIPYRKVGSRRKLNLKNVLAYKKASAAQRRKALRALVREAQELDMGY
jgi:excisionase family DNA binding protein